MKQNGKKVAITTGLYREITDLILSRLNWKTGPSWIDCVVTSDEVSYGKPRPLMIHKCMEMLGIKDPKEVVKIGDTPSDLIAGKRAHVLLSLGVTNGSHTNSSLSLYDNDGLLDSLEELPGVLKLIISREKYLKNTVLTE